MRLDDIEVTVRDGQLTINAERTQTSGFTGRWNWAPNRESPRMTTQATRIPSGSPTDAPMSDVVTGPLEAVMRRERDAGHKALVPYAWLSLACSVTAFVLFLVPATRRNLVTLNTGCILIWAGDSSPET